MMTSMRRFILTATSLLLLLVLAACGSQAQTPQRTTVAQNQRDVTYPGVAGVTLAGTLVIPAHMQGTRVPGVMIVAGSGPTDRNGNQHGGYTTNLRNRALPACAMTNEASGRVRRSLKGSRRFRTSPPGTNL